MLSSTFQRKRLGREQCDVLGVSRWITLYSEWAASKIMGGGDLLISREMWILLNFGDISFIILATRKVRFVLPKKKKINPHIRLIC